jgi:proteasome accessory factor A
VGPDLQVGQQPRPSVRHRRGHSEIEAAKDAPPQTTRAKLRGDFIAAAQAAGRDFTADRVHLKLNDQAHRTVLCNDPFRAVNERVERLIASL